MAPVVPETDIALFTAALEQLEDGVVITERRGTDHTIVFANAACMRLTGYGEDELIGSDCRLLQGMDRNQPGRHAMRDALAHNRGCRVLMRNYRKDGRLFWNELTLSPLRIDGEVSHYCGTLRDVSDRIALHAWQTGQYDALHHSLSEMSAMVLTDPLTGVANRRQFDACLEREWSVCQRQEAPLSVAIFDIDHFKPFNDTYGHQAGDDCLAHIARAIQGCFRRAGDLVVRYGGEEFIAVAPRTPIDAVLKQARRALADIEALNIPHRRNEPGIDHVTVSAGVASLVPEPSRSVGDLVFMADRALYVAKRQGRNCAQPYSDS